MELGAVRGFGLAPGTGPSAGLTSLQSTYILLSCTPPLALPAQARLWWCHCPGQLSLDNSTHGGRRSRKLEMSLQIICASFWGGGGIFFCFESWISVEKICLCSYQVLEGYQSGIMLNKTLNLAFLDYPSCIN